MFQNIGEMVVLFWRTLQALPRTWRQRRKVMEQLFEIGNASLLMACILSMFIGGVIALQTGPVLAERGLSSSIGGLVGLSMCKELAPVMMAVRPLKRQLGLPELKTMPGLERMVLVQKGSRLSVQPVSASEWAIIEKLGG